MTRKILFVFLTILLTSTACDIGGKKKMEEERMKQAQQKKEAQQNIVKPKGSTDAVAGLSNAVFKTKKYGNEWLEMTFSDKNTCTYKLMKEGRGNTIFSDHTAEYSITGNSITLDYSKQIIARMNATVENLREIFIGDYQAEIKQLEEKLQNTTLSKSERTKLEKRLEEDKRVVELIKQGKLDSSLFAEIIVYLQQTATAIKSINPITGELSADKNTLTVKKLLMEFKDGKPMYAENVVFTRVTK